MDVPLMDPARTPFSSVPDPECFVRVSLAGGACDEIADCLKTGRGIAILTAPAGLGKTLVCHRLQKELGGAFRVVLLPGGGYGEAASFLQAVLHELEQPYRHMSEQEMRLQLLSAVRQVARERDGLVLLLDEAETLSDAVLEEVRLATNLLQEGRPLVRVLLCGQFPLEEKLTAPGAAALNQRIACHVTLEPFSRAESAEYIRGRLERRQARLEDVFAARAVETIAIAADGSPRCLNRLCDRALALTSDAGERLVSEATVRQALEELKQLPLHWNDLPPLRPDRGPQKLPVTGPDDDPVPETSPPAVAVESAAAEGASAAIEFGGGHVEERAAEKPSAVEHGPEPRDSTSTEDEDELPPATPDAAESAVFEFGEDRSPLPGETGSEPVRLGQSEIAGVSDTDPHNDWEPVAERDAWDRRAESAPPNVRFGEITPTGPLGTARPPAACDAASPIVRSTPRIQTVDDRYAALRAEQERRRRPTSAPLKTGAGAMQATGNVAAPAVEVRLPQDAAAPVVSAGPATDRDGLPADEGDVSFDPETTIESVIAAVDAAADDFEPFCGDFPLPHGDEDESDGDEPPFDVVLPEDAEPPAARRNAVAGTVGGGAFRRMLEDLDPPRPYADLFTRLQRLREES